MTEQDFSNATDELDIAIVGMACRVPGAENIGQFWQNLRTGVESIEPLSKNDQQPNDRTNSQLKFVAVSASVPSIESFDAAFFGMSAREATLTDPQQRLFLEQAWAALEHAGYDSQNYSGSIAVYASVGMNHYYSHHVLPAIDVQKPTDAYMAMIGNDKDFLATRIAYHLDLTGPSISVQTACSSSLVAVHLAAQSLLSGECDMALAGGVSIPLHLRKGYMYQPGMIASPDGHCRAFDAEAEGTVFGSGMGVVVIKRLADAISDNDTIHAVIKGSAINNDGSTKAGYTAPGVAGQIAVITEAQAVADIDALSISYVETHGTGTAIGDPIEVQALSEAFSCEQKGFCALGSVKTNIGHLDAAAGVVSLIKTTLALKHKEIPPSLHFNKPNPLIDFSRSPFYVNNSLKAWPEGSTSRRAGISSFGIGGTNAHLIVEEAPQNSLSVCSLKPLKLIMLSAKTAMALDQLTDNLLEFITHRPNVALDDLAYTLQQGRRSFSFRRCIVTPSYDHLITQLKQRTDFNDVDKTDKTDLVFGIFVRQIDIESVFDLYAAESVFKSNFDSCVETIKRLLKIDLPGLHCDNVKTEHSIITQQLLGFSCAYSLTKLWQHWGVTPKRIVNDDIGEYVAAIFAGVFSLSDALMLFAKVFCPELKVQGSLNSLACRSASIKFTSSIDGQWLDEQSVTNLNYWLTARYDHVVAGVCSDVVPQLNIHSGVFNTFSGSDNQSLSQNMIHSLGLLWLQGYKINWQGYYHNERRQRVPLPSYPFERKKFWPAKPDCTGVSVTTELDKLDVEAWVNRLIVNGSISAAEAKFVPKMISLLKNASQPFDELYDIQWRKQRIHNKPEDITDLPEGESGKDSGQKNAAGWLIFCDSEGVGDKLVEQLQKAGEDCVSVHCADHFQATDDGIGIDPHNPADYVSLTETINSFPISINKVVYCWALDGLNSSGFNEIDDLSIAIKKSCGSILNILQILSQSLSEPPEKLWMVTHNAAAFPLREDEIDLSSLSQSPLWGMAKVIPLEYAGLSSSIIDLAGELNITAATQLLLQEFSAENPEEQLVYYKGERYVARLQSCSKETYRPLNLSANVNYLITGGMGVIGLKLARWMVERGARHITLVGRRSLSELSLQVCQEIQALEAKGATITKFSCDVCDPHKMSRVVKQIEQGEYPLKGIIHAAGVGGAMALQDMSYAEFNKVIRPKTLGAWNLHHLTEKLQLDFFICFSSAGSVWGAREQGHYDAANYFLDALCYFRKNFGLKALSINWGVLATGGIATTEYKDWLSSIGMEQMESARVLEILSSLMGSDATQVVATRLDEQRFVDIYTSYVRSSLFSELCITPADADKDRSTVNQHIRPPRITDISVLKQEINNIVVSILGNNSTDQIDDDRGFNDLGMDSILAVALRSELQSVFNCALPATIAFDYPNLSSLTGYINKQLSLSTVKSSPIQLNAPEPQESTAPFSRDDDSISKAIAEELLKIEGMLND